MPTTENESMTKGVSIITTERFVRDRFGDEAWEAILGRLSHGDAESIRGTSAVGWYPLRVYGALLHALADVSGDGRSTIVTELARTQAEHDLNVIFRVLLRLGSPAVVVEKATSLWSRFHTTGRWDIERVGDRGVTGTLVDWGAADEILCVAVGSYTARLFELVGAKDVRLFHPRCRALGASECRFEIRWA